MEETVKRKKYIVEGPVDKLSPPPPGKVGRAILSLARHELNLRNRIGQVEGKIRQTESALVWAQKERATLLAELESVLAAMEALEQMTEQDEA